MSTCSAISWWEDVTFRGISRYHSLSPSEHLFSYIMMRTHYISRYFEISFFITKWAPVQLYHGENTLHFEVSFFYTKWAPVQLYHGVNTLQFNEMKTKISIVHFKIIRNLNTLDFILNTTYMICVLKNVIDNYLFILIK